MLDSSSSAFSLKLRPNAWASAALSVTAAAGAEAAIPLWAYLHWSARGQWPCWKSQHSCTDWATSAGPPRTLPRSLSRLAEAIRKAVGLLMVCFMFSMSFRSRMAVRRSSSSSGSFTSEYEIFSGRGQRWFSHPTCRAILFSSSPTGVALGAAPAGVACAADDHVLFWPCVFSAAVGALVKGTNREAAAATYAVGCSMRADPSSTSFRIFMAAVISSLESGSITSVKDILSLSPARWFSQPTWRPIFPVGSRAAAGLATARGSAGGFAGATVRKGGTANLPVTATAPSVAPALLAAFST
mmetsp:Transcript_38937/g.121233  ORF Transcript_38937/g.121233 Transcript_38937/m.121233 type:complete len:299 (+) Transcript_38937:456-1352(+)